MKPNRTQRRYLRRYADQIAETWATLTLRADGGYDRNAPGARRALKRGFAALVKNDLKPVIRRLRPSEVDGLCDPEARRRMRAGSRRSAS